MTYQIRDILYFEEKEYRLNCYILEPYFFSNPKLRPYGNGGTALRRGYIGTFTIIDEKLTVINLEILSSEFGDLDIKSVFKKTFNGNKICDWYSGLIRIDENKGRFNEEKEEYIFEYLEFYKGTFIGKRIMDYYELQNFKSNQYKKFKETVEFRELYNRISKSKIGEYETNKIIIENILEFIPEVY
ncbi:hypothetical protein [Psychroserpens sp. S379A]|uniref:hypothetical protein n=1 Tax=Psychroserpens sp. S379A TaxID=3415137 RepID=UPI003C7AE460